MHPAPIPRSRLWEIDLSGKESMKVVMKMILRKTKKILKNDKDVFISLIES